MTVRLSVSPGDLVKYKHYHNNLQTLRGIVLRVTRDGERVKVLWNRIDRNDEVLDWVEDVEIIKTCPGSSAG